MKIFILFILSLAINSLIVEFKLYRGNSFIVTQNLDKQCTLDYKSGEKKFLVNYYFYEPQADKKNTFEFLYYDKAKFVYKNLELTEYEESKLNDMFIRFPALNRLVATREEMDDLKWYTEVTQKYKKIRKLKY
jgi:hypothetical protein